MIQKSKILRWALILMLLVGTISRAAPLLNIDGRLQKQWVTEDGYLMLTIARNLAIGKGMSISDGEIKTNGTQPLVTLIFAAAYKAFDGDKIAGLYFAHGWEILISLLTCWVIFLFSRDVLKDTAYANSVPMMAAGFWFISPVFVSHSMNHLETGTYYLMVILSVWAWYRWISPQQESTKLGLAAVLGVLLGITTLVRIDAVFLIAAMTVWNVLPALIGDRASFKKRLQQSFVMGAISVVVTSPWLIYNKVGFGSFTPISGSAQKLEASFGKNLTDVSPTLAEFAGIAFPIPIGLKKTTPVRIATAIVMLAWLIVHIGLMRKATSRQRLMMAILGTYTVSFVVYYGLIFGAPYFLKRYMSPTGIFFVISTCLIVAYFLKQLKLEHSKIAYGGLIALLLVCFGLHGRLYATKGLATAGAGYCHWHVVEWIGENVDDETWVGAIQTGTVGYFHDRTINLDGKVNPEALEARVAKAIPDYVVDGPVQFLADWQSILEWHRDFQKISDNFDVVADLPEANSRFRGLGVMRRKPNLHPVSIDSTEARR